MNAQPLQLKPWEFEIHGATYRICGDKTERRFQGLWIRIDRGNPDRIGQLFRVGVLLLLAVILLPLDEFPRPTPAGRPGRVEMNAL